MFGGTDDHDTYAEGLRRGGIMLVAHVDDAKVDDTIRILEKHGSVDLEERETTWRSEGWTGGAAVTGGGVADTGAGPLRSLSPVVETKPVVAPAMTPTETVKPAVVAPVSSARAGGDDVLQVVEESLNVGKRAVNRGKVRIHSYVVETPVTETVSLRDETVSVDRRPVDRALGLGELGVDAFKDRTIEMEEIDEEAVVAKNVRVVEEIGHPQGRQGRVRTITDTVRSTKVDIRGRAHDRDPLRPDRRLHHRDRQGHGGHRLRRPHVGIIDHVDGSTIKLKKNDPASAEATT